MERSLKIYLYFMYRYVIILYDLDRVYRLSLYPYLIIIIIIINVLPLLLELLKGVVSSSSGRSSIDEQALSIMGFSRPLVTIMGCLSVFI